jgi:hypothetical protein
VNSQRDRLLGLGRHSRVPNRPELVARYGYDVKYASHALRLAYQGLEIVRDGRLTLPMPDHERQWVLRVKRGEVAALEVVINEINNVQADIEAMLYARQTPLPPTRTRSPTGPPLPIAGTGTGTRCRHSRTERPDSGIRVWTWAG